MIAAGSIPPPGTNYTANVEQWNGSTWTEINNVNQVRTQLSGSGLTTDGLVFGGYDPSSGTGKTESFDGTSFTEVADLATARWDVKGAGNSGLNGLAAGGDSPSGKQDATEEWTAASFEIKSVTMS